MVESIRAAKRRKLDTLEEARSKSTSGERPAQPPRSGRESASTGVEFASGAHEAWKQAKAKAQELRGKRAASSPQKPKSADVYDDIDGAHSGKSRLLPLANLTSTPKSKRLEPLRNQLSASPSKPSASKANPGLGFFKQFTRPKETDETLQRRQEEHVVNGGSHTLKGGNGAHEKVLEDDHESQPVTQSGKGAWKRWAYAEGPRKTFEDEIRQLETAAREKAENGGDEGIFDRASLRRQGKHSVTPIVAAHKAEWAANRNEKPRVAPQAAKNVKWKVYGPKATPQVAERKVSDAQGDQLDVDGDENELEQRLRDEIGSAPHTATPFKEKLQQPAQKRPPQDLHCVDFQPRELEVIKTIILEKLTDKRPARLCHLDDEYAKIASVITQTVTAGESNSMLVIGSRGSGKTKLVNQILREQAVGHSDDFHVVRLNGFIHTDDKIALRDIWRQLGREMELDGEESNLKNYADTLTSLLALLSHPAEQGRDQPGHTTKSVIFVLDEFELFASHPRQTLLYNLFDIAQSRKAPIAVLGLTAKVDVAESLEKRVKSRFSHRYVHLSSAKSFAAFQEACTAALAIHEDDMTDDERHVLTGASPKAGTKTAQAPGESAGTTLNNWASFVNTLFAEQETSVCVRHIYFATKSVPAFKSSMLLPFSALRTDTPISTSDLLKTLTPILAVSAPDSKLSLLSGLSTLHLALLVCAARLTAIHAQDTVPFAQAYEEYKTIASKAKIQASASGALAQGAGGRIWSKGVARSVWDELMGMGLVIADGARGGRVDVGLEEIGMSGIELGAWGRWCREI